MKRIHICFIFILLQVSLWSHAEDGVLKEIKLSKDNYIENDKKSLKAELLIQKTEKKAIKQIKKLIKKYRGTPLEADMLLRLAELYMRRSKTALFFEMNRDSKHIVSFTPKEIKKNSSKVWILKAISIYDDIQKRYPEFTNLDEVIFNEAMACHQVNLKGKSERLHWKLIKKFPYSDLVPDSHLAIGEINFGRKNFSKALSHFEAIKKYPNSRVYPYGLYKAAWSKYNLQKTASGLAELEAVVEYGVFASKNGIDARLDLRKEALSDMTLFFEEVHPSERAFDYFTQQAGEYDPTTYILKLARLYGSHNKVPDELIVYKSYLKKSKKIEYFPKVYHKIVSAYEGIKDRENAVSELLAMSNYCHNSFPKNNNQNNQKVISLSSIQKSNDPSDSNIIGCHEQVTKTSLHLAKKWLELWKKNKTYPIFANSSQSAFEVYLKSKDRSFEKSKMRFVYSELLFKRKKYELSSLQYAMVGQYFYEENQKIKELKIEMAKKHISKDIKGNLKAKLKSIKYDKIMAHDADYAAIVSLEKLNEKLNKGIWTSDLEKKLLELSEFYVTRHEKPRYQLDIQFKLALLYYNKKEYKKAEILFKQLGDRFAKKEKGIKSQDLYLDILNKQKRYTEIKKYSVDLMKNKINKIRHTKIHVIFQESSFLEIQQLQTTDNLKETIKKYKKFALDNMKSHLAPKAWANAIELQYKRKRPLSAALSSLKYAKLFPREKNKVNYLLRTAKTYEDLAMLSKAADILLALSEFNSVEKEHKSSQNQWKKLSADYYYLIGQRTKAKNIYYSLIGDLDKEISNSSLIHIERIYNEEMIIKQTHLVTKDHRKIINLILQKNIQPESSLLTLNKVQKLYEDKKYPEAFTEAKTILNMKGNFSNHAKAQARYIQARILADEFEKQSLKSRIDRLTTVIQIKTAKLEKAQKAYQSAIRYGDSQVTIKSLGELSDLYNIYSQQLRTMPFPKGLPETDQAAFRAEIENLAMPMEDNGIDTLVQALNQIKKLNVFGDGPRKLQEKFNKRNMVKSEKPLISVSDPSIVLPINKEVKREI